MRKSPSTTAPTRSARGCSSGSARGGSIDTPISEEGLLPASASARRWSGLRPIIEFMTFSFSLVAIDQIVNNAANMRVHERRPVRRADRVPRQLGDGRLPGGDPLAPAGGLVRPGPRPDRDVPGHARRRQGTLKCAIRSDDPVVFIEHENLSARKGEVPEGEHLVPIGKADIKRAGSDVTLITYSRSLKTTLAAAEKLAEEGIDAEVIDLRTIRPLDLDTLLASVVKTHRAVIVEEDWPYCGLARGSPTGSLSAPSTSLTPRSAASPPRTRRSPTTARRSPGGASKSLPSRTVDR